MNERQTAPSQTEPSLTAHWTAIAVVLALAVLTTLLFPAGGALP